jgi:dodecin
VGGSIFRLVSARLHMEGFAQTLSVPPPGGLDSGVFCLNIFLTAARGAHADSREPTDSLSQYQPRRPMADSVYKVVEVVGTSNESISKAISRAISKAGATLRHLGWFEVVQIRGSIENDQIRQYQVTVKVGFTLEED